MQELGFPADVEQTTLAAPVHGKGFLRAPPCPAPPATTAAPPHPTPPHGCSAPPHPTPLAPAAGQAAPSPLPSDPGAKGAARAPPTQLHSTASQDDAGDGEGARASRTDSAASAGSTALEWQSSRAVLARLSGQLSLPPPPDPELKVG